MSSPFLWGPNNKANNLEEGAIQPSGTYNRFDGPKNYIGFNNFENGLTTGWSLGTVGTLTNGIPTGSPTFGSGATNLVLAAATISPIAGTYSLALTTTAATTVGNMVGTQAYSIDVEDQAKVLTFKFYYSVIAGLANCNFSGTSSNSFGIAIWDATNSVWLSSTANFGMTQGTGAGYVTGTCQTNATTLSIQLVIYAANPTTGTTTQIYFDDFFLGPQTAPLGAVISDLQQYTPTFVGITATPQNVEWGRHGDCLFLNGSFTWTAGSGSTFSMSLPAGLSVNTSKVTTTTAFGLVTPNSVSTPGSFAFIANGGATTLNIGYTDSASGGLASIIGTTFANGSIVTFGSILIPIAGWSSNVQMSSDTDTRVIAATCYASSATFTPGANTQINYDTKLSDTAGAVTVGAGAWKFTAPVTGNYFITATAGYSSGSAGNLFLYKNGSQYAALGGGSYGNTAGLSLITSSSITIPLNTDDFIDIRPNSGVTFQGGTLGNGTYISINRLSGPSVIAATESVNMSYFSSTSTVTASLATITYATKTRDSHNDYASGVYTIPVSGMYQANAAIAISGTFSLNATLDLQIQQTGSAAQISEQKVYAGGIETALTATASNIFYCLPGDTLKVQASSSAASPVIVSSNSQNYISICRVGN